ncbi:MAG: hypothetical protein ACHQKY_04390 [Terriglobia bacterium]
MIDVAQCPDCEGRRLEGSTLDVEYAGEPRTLGIFQCLDCDAKFQMTSGKVDSWSLDDAEVLRLHDLRFDELRNRIKFCPTPHARECRCEAHLFFGRQ